MSNVLKVSLQVTIKSLADRGWSQRRIAGGLGIDRETVRRYIGLSKPAISITGLEDRADPKPAISIAGNSSSSAWTRSCSLALSSLFAGISSTHCFSFVLLSSRPGVIWIELKR